MWPQKKGREGHDTRLKGSLGNLPYCVKSKNKEIPGCVSGSGPSTREVLDLIPITGFKNNGLIKFSQHIALKNLTS